MCKFCALEVTDVYLRFLNAYLEPRVGRVTIESVCCDLIVLPDTVFQGTNLEPALWDAFSHDVALAASRHGGDAVMFADDLRVIKKFPASLDNLAIKADMTSTRTEVHRWEKRNRVVFDPAKEYIIVVRPNTGEADALMFLDVLFDVNLTMANVMSSSSLASDQKSRLCSAPVLFTAPST